MDTNTRTGIFLSLSLSFCFELMCACACVKVCKSTPCSYDSYPNLEEYKSRWFIISISFHSLLSFLLILSPLTPSSSPSLLLPHLVLRVKWLRFDTELASLVRNFDGGEGGREVGRGKDSRLVVKQYVPPSLPPSLTLSSEYSG